MGSSQNVPERIDLAFKAFFRRCKSGEKPGYPRFKGKDRYHSFTYPQNNGAFKIIDGNRIRLSKIGNVKIKLHRPIVGEMKTCVVKREATGKWFVCISCTDVPVKKLKPNKVSIGIDLGLSSFATLSNGNKIENPRFFRKEEQALSKTQRKKGKKKVIARIHERIRSKRNNFCHQESRKIVNNYGIICVEDLDIQNMLVNGTFPRLHKSIADAAWGQFVDCTSYKAENAGRTFVKGNPAFTSQDCSGCGTRQKIDLSVRTYSCGKCGLVIDRDLNAARNILAVGLHSLARA